MFICVLLNLKITSLQSTIKQTKTIENWNLWSARNTYIQYLDKQQVLWIGLQKIKGFCIHVGRLNE